jgi:DNA-binding response OmpR family regulator
MLPIGNMLNIALYPARYTASILDEPVMKLLLVEDDRQLADQLSDALSSQRYVVDIARDGQEGWDLIRTLAYDLIILDLTLPKIDGISLCRLMRGKGYQTPVLMLTGNSADRDKIAGLDSGADDYLIKPIALNELVARLRALARRHHKELTPVLVNGQLKLDPGSCTVTYGDVPLKVSPKEYHLLELFMRNGHRVYSRKAILDLLWGLDDELPSEDTVKAHIRGLRQRLKTVGIQELIQSVYGLGYRLNPNYQEPSAIEPALPRVLLLNWSVDQLPRMQQALHPWTVSAETMHQAVELLPCLEEQQPQLLLLDIAADPLKNLELCRELRQSVWAWLPVVVLAKSTLGEIQTDIQHEAFTAGVDDYLVRPIAIRDLKLRLANRLERVKTLRSAVPPALPPNLATASMRSSAMSSAQ